MNTKQGKVLLATVALSVTLVASCDDKPIIYGNPKGCRYDDAGVEVCGPDEHPDASVVVDASKGPPDGGSGDGGGDGG